jgi:metallophosphoesterase superfamily enzyme
VSAQRSAPSHEVADGVFALPQSLVYLERTGTLVAADVHLAYEDVIGGALPLWSTASAVALLEHAIARTHARELVLLGDIIHGTRMSEGAARVVVAALDALRSQCAVVLVAGNHEGRTRGAAVLGDTVEACDRDGWLLTHGDVPSPVRSIVGHLHPSLRVGSAANAPVVLANERLVVVPALTPYSSGLDVMSQACARAVRAFGADSGTMQVVASGDDCVFPFGVLGEVRAMLGGGVRGEWAKRRERKVLRSDRP